jgi:hypothetical protein
MKRNFLFVFLLISSLSYCQSASDDVVEVNQNRKDNNVETSTNVNFILWFMGGVQKTESLQNNPNPYREIIISGRNPNRILLKTFYKKILRMENAVS